MTFYSFCCADVEKRHTSVENALVYLKPHLASSPNAVEHIITALAEHHVKVVGHTKMPAKELKSRKIFQTQYATLRDLACVKSPREITLSLSEEKAFRATFDRQPWEDALALGSIYNEVQACDHLATTPAVLNELWEQAEFKVRLRKGFYVAKLDRNCTTDAFMKKKLLNPIFVVNGFYRTLEAQYCDTSHPTDYFVCEWDEGTVSWSTLLQDVIGGSDPATAPPTSVRGSIFAQWESLGLPGPPSAAQNCVHVSQSAFEGLTERLRWKKGSMLFTDLFGSRLLSVRLKSAQINEWMQNPTIDHKPLFEHLQALNSADCISFLLKLAEGDKK